MRNAFNEDNRTSMLWAVRYEWPGGTQFIFICYRHWYMLVVRDTLDGSGHFLHSKEGVTQGDPLAMIAYDIGVLPVIRYLRRAHPRVTQPWYVDDAGAGGEFGEIMAHFRDLQLRGPAWGYYPEPTKSILVVADRNVPRAKEYFRGMGIQVVTGSRYLCGFVREREAEAILIQEKVEGWVESVRTLSGVSRKHPQSVYAGMQKSLQ